MAALHEVRVLDIYDRTVAGGTRHASVFTVPVEDSKEVREGDVLAYKVNGEQRLRVVDLQVGLNVTFDNPKMRVNLYLMHGKDAPIPKIDPPKTMHELAAEAAWNGVMSDPHGRGVVHSMHTEGAAMLRRVVNVAANATIAFLLAKTDVMAARFDELKAQSGKVMHRPGQPVILELPDGHVVENYGKPADDTSGPKVLAADVRVVADALTLHGNVTFNRLQIALAAIRALDRARMERGSKAFFDSVYKAAAVKLPEDDTSDDDDPVVRDVVISTAISAAERHWDVAAQSGRAILTLTQARQTMIECVGQAVATLKDDNDPKKDVDVIADEMKDMGISANRQARAYRIVKALDEARAARMLKRLQEGAR